MPIFDCLAAAAFISRFHLSLFITGFRRHYGALAMPRAMSSAAHALYGALLFLRVYFRI